MSVVWLCEGGKGGECEEPLTEGVKGGDGEVGMGMVGDGDGVKVGLQEPGGEGWLCERCTTLCGECGGWRGDNMGVDSDDWSSISTELSTHFFLQMITETTIVIPTAITTSPRSSSLWLARRFLSSADISSFLKWSSSISISNRLFSLWSSLITSVRFCKGGR